MGEPAIKLIRCDGCDDRDQRIADLEALLGKVDRVFDRDKIKMPRQTEQIAALFLKRAYLSRDAIYTVLFEGVEDDGPTINTISVQIVRVRSALLEHGIALETVWGQGWRMSTEDRIKLRALTIEYGHDPIEGVLPGLAPWR